MVELLSHNIRTVMVTGFVVPLLNPYHGIILFAWAFYWPTYSVMQMRKMNLKSPYELRPILVMNSFWLQLIFYFILLFIYIVMIRSFVHIDCYQLPKTSCYFGVYTRLEAWSFERPFPEGFTFLTCMSSWETTTSPSKMYSYHVCWLTSSHMWRIW